MSPTNSQVKEADPSDRTGEGFDNDLHPGHSSNKARRRRLIAIAATLGIMLVLLFLPVLFSRSPLRSSLFSYAIGTYPGDFQVGATQLDWWHPVEIQQISMDDLSEEPWLEVERLQTEQSLFFLAMPWNASTHLQLFDPRVCVQWDAEGSNLAQLWKAYVNANKDRRVDGPPVFIEVFDGSIFDCGDSTLDINVADLDGSFELQEEAIAGQFTAMVGDAELHASPIVTWAEGDVTVASSSPIRLESAELSPRAVNNWIAMVTPMLSGASELEGKMSARVESLHLSLSEPKSSTLEGELEIEAGRIAAGPLAQLIIDTGKRLYAILEEPETGTLPVGDRWSIELPRQTVPFYVQNGAFHHRSLTLDVGGLLLETSGSVAFDGGLDMQLKTKIPDRWVDESPYLEDLAGEQLRFGIRGTLSEPALDDQALVDLLKHLGTKVVLESMADSLEEPVLELFGF